MTRPPATARRHVSKAHELSMGFVLSQVTPVSIDKATIECQTAATREAVRSSLCSGLCAPSFYIQVTRRLSIFSATVSLFVAHRIP
jgi:hypothetical protein